MVHRFFEILLLVLSICGSCRCYSGRQGIENSLKKLLPTNLIPLSHVSHGLKRLRGSPLRVEDAIISSSDSVVVSSRSKSLLAEMQLNDVTLQVGNYSYTTGYVYSQYFNSTPSCRGTANFAYGLYFGWCWQLSNSSSLIQYIDLGNCTSSEAVLVAYFNSSSCTGYYTPFFTSLSDQGFAGVDSCYQGATSFCSSHNYFNISGVAEPYAKVVLLEGDSGQTGFEGCSAGNVEVYTEHISLDTCAYTGNSSFVYVHDESVGSTEYEYVKGYSSLADCVAMKNNVSYFTVAENDCNSFQYYN